MAVPPEGAEGAYLRPRPERVSTATRKCTDQSHKAARNAWPRLVAGGNCANKKPTAHSQKKKQSTRSESACSLPFLLAVCERKVTFLDPIPKHTIWMTSKLMTIYSSSVSRSSKLCAFAW